MICLIIVTDPKVLRGGIFTLLDYKKLSRESALTNGVLFFFVQICSWTQKKVVVCVQSWTWSGLATWKRPERCNVPICPDHRPFLKFAFNGQSRVLPYGLFLSPRVFTRVLAAALSPHQQASSKLLLYLDIWLICTPSQGQIVQDTESTVPHVQNLGFKVNLEQPRPDSSCNLCGVVWIRS